MLKEEIIESCQNALNQYSKYFETERTKLIQENIKDKGSEEIITYLINTPVKENGGITAISGFYYQFLVAIQYIIEMLEGKWDFIAIELHDDIVVGKGNRIRFVQVKTSQKATVKANEVSNLYKREEKFEDKTNYKINNSWIDKLLSKAQFFPRSKQYKTEFELYTSYHIVKSNQNNFDIYTNNCNYYKDIPNNDSLYTKLKEKVFDSDLKEYNYTEKCGEDIKDLLTRLYLRTGISFGELEMFESYLKDKIGEKLFPEEGNENLKLSNEDLKAFIGILCSKCTIEKESASLIIHKENIDSYLNPIRKRILLQLDEFLNEHGNKQLIDQALDRITYTVKDYPQSQDMNNLLSAYRDYLYSWVEHSGGSIRDLLSRYIEGNTINYHHYSTMDKTIKTEKLSEVIFLINILNLINQCTLEFIDENWFLTKQKDNQYWFAFLGVEKGKYKKAIDKIAKNLERTFLKDVLNIQSKKIYMVLHGYRDRNFTKIEIKEFEARIKEDDDGLSSSFFSRPKLNHVPITIKVVPGNELEAELYELLDEGSFNNIVDKMKYFWNEMEG